MSDDYIESSTSPRATGNGTAARGIQSEFGRSSGLLIRFVISDIHRCDSLEDCWFYHTTDLPNQDVA